LTYRSYLWKQGGNELRLIFRDHFLSDQVGFVYSKMDATEAADQFLERIRANARPLAAGGADVLVPIILDGENAWEYYYQNGRPFLRELYSRISRAEDLDALTVSEALRIDRARRLDHIFPGSWINANFDVWIGAQEDNQAWEYLLRARKKFDELEASVSEEARRLAFEELLIAEGSDWCWWYGPEHHSENRLEFDALYRQHLANVYRALNVAPPEELSRPILMTQAAYSHQPPTNRIHATIDGEVTSYFEWMGAGRYRGDARSGAMHGPRNTARELFYGADGSNLFVRLDFDGAPEFTVVELRTKQGVIALSSDPGVEHAQRRVFEARVPFELLKLSGEERLSFQIALLNEGVALEQIPRDGWIELTPAAGN
jgi:Glycosyl hydrolase family 57